MVSPQVGNIFLLEKNGLKVLQEWDLKKIRLIGKVVKQENNYWLEDEQLDEIFAADNEENETVLAFYENSEDPYLVDC